MWYFAEYVCPNKELQVLRVINGCENEVIDDELPSESMELSLISFFGITPPTTTKMRGSMEKF